MKKNGYEWDYKYDWEYLWSDNNALSLKIYITDAQL